MNNNLDSEAYHEMLDTGKIREWGEFIGYGEPEGHADQCTSAWCKCGLGYRDGTPMSCDYRNAGQPLPGYDLPIDAEKVYSEIRKRMAKNDTEVC